MSIILKIKKKYKQIQKAWCMDVHFSKKYARLRRKEIICDSLGFHSSSNKAFEKREKFIIDYLTDTISPVIEKYKNDRKEGESSIHAPIWMCWWTGINTAPKIVQQCIKSIYKNAGDHEVIFISKDNYSEYVEVPEFIFQKMQNKTMGLAHFCDYLRVALLEKHGGLWLDTTIFCSETISEQLFNNPFFTLKSHYKESRYVSKYQWVTFCLGGWKGNLFYSFVKEAFEAYWSKNEYAIDYLFFDYIIYLGRENCPYIMQLMDAVPENTPHRDDLQAAMNARLSADEFDRVIKPDTGLYKLSWRETYSDTTPDGEESIYKYFLRI